jgi:mannose-1-phosphate guanylyltransferase
MRALLLAGGTGSRLRPLTLTVPKCLVTVQGKPLLDYWLDLLFNAGFERTLINTHWLADKVTAHVKTSPWRDRIDIAHEAELLGTGGTIMANHDYFGTGAFLVAHADNLTDFDARGLAAAHAARPEGCAITMLAFETDDPRSCGILELNAQNVVVGFHEKIANPPGNLANGAVYIVEPEVVTFIERLNRSFVDLSTEVLPAFVGRIYAVETKGYHRDIGNLISLQRAEQEFRGQNAHSRCSDCASLR